MNFYITSPLEVAWSPLSKALLVLVSSSSGTEMPFTAQQRKGTGGAVPFPFTCTPRKAPSPELITWIHTGAPGNYA